MGIQLDEVAEQPGFDVEEQRVAARAAVEAVRYWEQVLRQRVSEAEALDGWIASTLSALMGTREARLDEAVARVQEARERLAAARATAEAAQRDLDHAEARHRASQDAEVERVGRLEMLADQIRGTAHPLAAELDAIELGIDGARTELEPLAEATSSGSALLAWLGTAGVQAQQGTTAAILDVGDVPLAGLNKLSRFHSINTTMKEVAPRAQRFERACAALGIPVELDFGDIRAPSMALDLVTDGLLADVYSLDRIQDVQYRLDLARDDVRRVLDPLHERHRALTQEVRALEARRAALLERVGG